LGPDPVQVIMSIGKIIITNNRIIAQGGIEVKGGSHSTVSILDLIVVPLSGQSRRNKIRKELPRDGYEIPIKNIGKLRVSRKEVGFEVKNGNFPGIVIIKPRETSKVKLEETVDNICELLSELNRIEYSTFNRWRPLICVVIIIIGVVLSYIIW